MKKSKDVLMSYANNGCETSLYSVLRYLLSVICYLLASPKLLLLGIVKVNFFSALAYSQLSLFIKSSVAHEPFFV